LCIYGIVATIPTPMGQYIILMEWFFILSTLYAFGKKNV